MLVAVVASAIAHGAVLLMPYLGRDVSSEAVRSRAPASPYAITVRLASPPVPPTEDQKAVPDTVITHSPDTRSSGNAKEQVTNTIGTNLLPIAGMTFYPTDQLSKRPQPVVAVDFDAPELGGIAQAGKIVLRLWIDENGAVADVKLDKTDLPETITAPVVAIFRRSQFLPGERGGKRVGSIMKIEVDIDPRPPLR